MAGSILSVKGLRVLKLLKVKGCGISLKFCTPLIFKMGLISFVEKGSEISD